MSSTDKNNDASTGNNKSGSSNNNNNSSKDAAKMLLSLAKQDQSMARRQHLLQTFLQMGASLSDVKEIYELSPSALNRDVLFEAGKLGAPPKILKFLLEKLLASQPSYARYSAHLRTFALQQEQHLMTTGNVATGLQQIIYSNVVVLKAAAPDSAKPFWNLKEFVESFLTDFIKSTNLEHVQFTFPIKEGTPSVAGKPKEAVPTATTASTTEATATITAKDPPAPQPSQLQQQKPHPHSMSLKIKAKLQPKKLEQSLLKDVRVKASYSHKTSDCLLQLIRSLANLPKLNSFSLQLQKDAANPKGYKEFKQQLPEAIGKLISTSKTLEILVLDVADFKKGGTEWEPLLKVLKKNPSLKRLLIRGFQGQPSEAAVNNLPRRYKREEATHTLALESFKRKLLEVVESGNSTLIELRFVIPGCHCCDSRFKFCANNRRFHDLNPALLVCTPGIVAKEDGTREIPGPKCVPELDHLLALNAHGRAELQASNMTYQQWLAALTKSKDNDNNNNYNKFPNDVPVLYAHLRSRAHYVPTLYSMICPISNAKSRGYFNPDMEELNLAAQGVLALPLERFVDLLLRRMDSLTSVYQFLQENPNCWLDKLETAKQLVKAQQTRKTKKDYLSVEELAERTQIVKTGTKTVITGTTTTRVAVYGTRVVATLDDKTQKPRKVIRLNVAPSVDHATKAKFPKLIIGARGGALVAKRKKTNDDTTSTTLSKQPLSMANRPSKQPTTTSGKAVVGKQKATTKQPAIAKRKVDGSNLFGKQKPLAFASSSTSSKSAFGKQKATTKQPAIAKRKVDGSNKWQKVKKGKTTGLVATAGVGDEKENLPVEPTVAKMPSARSRRRRSTANKPTSRSSPLSDLIGVASSSDDDEEDLFEKGGADSDWEDEGLEVETGDGDSDWSMDE